MTDRERRKLHVSGSWRIRENRSWRTKRWEGRWSLSLSLSSLLIENDTRTFLVASWRRNSQSSQQHRVLSWRSSDNLCHRCDPSPDRYWSIFLEVSSTNQYLSSSIRSTVAFSLFISLLTLATFLRSRVNLQIPMVGIHLVLFCSCFRVILTGGKRYPNEFPIEGTSL